MTPSKRLSVCACKKTCQRVNMADNSAKVANMARVLAIIHIIVGFLLICLGIADRVVDASGQVMDVLGFGPVSG